MVQIFQAIDPADDPVCSICIANFNGVALLPDCIDSVYSQAAGIAVEIIVHDDASTDDSVALLRKQYPGVTLLASAENVGFCIANNRMAERARGEFLLLLNNDAALLPDALETLLAHARAQPRQGILTLPQYDWRTGDIVDRGALLDCFYNPIPNLDPARLDVAMVIGACLWIPRSLWTTLGGFPTWMESIAEDMYLCCEARLRGWPVQAAARSGYRHWQGKSFSGDRPVHGLQSSFRRRALSERNKTFVLVVFTPGPAMWALLGLHLAFLLAEGLALSAIKRDLGILRRIYLPAIAAAWARLPQLREHRAASQGQRAVSLGDFFAPMRCFPQKLRLLGKHGIPHLR